MIKFTNLGKQLYVMFINANVQKFILAMAVNRNTALHGSGGQALTSQLGGQRSIQIYCMWGLWTKWKWDWFPPNTSFFPYNYHFTDSLQP